MPPVDTSIYGNIRPPQIDQVSPLDSMTKALTLSHIAMQNKELQRTQDEQDAVRSAFSSSLKPDGTPDTDLALSKINKAGFTMAAMNTQNMLAQQAAAKADMQNKMMHDSLTRADTFGRQLASIANLDPDEQAKAYTPLIQRLKQEGIILPNQNIPDDYNQQFVNQTIGRYYQSKDHIEDALKQAEAAKAASETRLKELEAPLDRAKTVAETNELIGKTPKQIDLTNVGPNTDPATLIQALPQAKQEEVAKEMKRAQDVGAAAPTIVQKMKDAIAAVSGTGRLTSLIHSPRAIDALHVALAPTFSDLGENARPALMEQFYKEIDPRPGDTAADFQTRMDALLEHLKAKSSAPMAKSLGIDLEKFNSTKQYNPDEDSASLAGLAKQVAKNSKSSGGSGGVLESTASADDGGSTAKTAPLPTPKPGDVRKGHVFLGGDASKQENWKKQ